MITELLQGVDCVFWKVSYIVTLRFCQNNIKIKLRFCQLFFYTHYSEEKHRNDIEIDFLITESNSVGSHLIPIEVKSSKNYSATSLNDFLPKYKQRIKKSFIIHPKNLSVKENGSVAIPPYMTICL